MRSKKDRIDRRHLRAWLELKEISRQDIQKALGYRSNAPVVETLNGLRSYTKVLNWLRDQGCPAEYLQLPERKSKEKK